MKAVIVREHGGLEALRFEELPEPRPRADEVLVEVRAAAVNHLDLWVRRGVPGHSYPLPIIPGNDLAGVVLETGAPLPGLAPGDEVVLAPGVSCGACAACAQGRDHRCRDYGILGEHRDGGYAQRVVVPRVNALPKPANLSFAEAASMPLTFLTAWHMLVERAAIRPGEWVLVHAGGSGVGSAAIQIAKLWGAVVVTTVGSEAKAARARELGADHVVNYREAPFDRVVRELTGRRGVEVVIEHVGAATWEGSLRALAWHGRLVTCGATDGAEVPLNLRAVFFKSLSILGSTMGSRGELREVLAHAAAGRLRPVVDRVLPLSEAREAHRLLEAREAFGKIVLTP